MSERLEHPPGEIVLEKGKIGSGATVIISGYASVGRDFEIHPDARVVMLDGFDCLPDTKGIEKTLTLEECLQLAENMKAQTTEKGDGEEAEKDADAPRG